MTASSDHSGEKKSIKTFGGEDGFSLKFCVPLFMGSALNPINSSVIATALVPISEGIHVSVGATVVLITSLYLASAIAQPTAGKLATEFGPRRVFVAGIVTVLFGGMVGGLATNLVTLVVSRILIGVGTSAGYPSAMMIIRRQAENTGLQQPPGGVLGGLQIAATVSAAIGLPLGGVLVYIWGWRSAFFINVPMTVITLITAVVWVPQDGPLDRIKSFRKIVTRIDAVGIAGFCSAMIFLLLFLFALPNVKVVELLLSFILFVVLTVWELRVSRPFIDIRLIISNLALTRTYVRFGLSTLCIYTVFYGVTQWLELDRGISAESAGLLLLPMGIVGAIVSRPISTRNLLRGPLIMAAVSSIFGSAGLLFVAKETPTIWILAIMLVFGVTLGTASIGNQAALYSQASSIQIGTASGLFRTFAYLGSIASSAIIGSVFQKGVSDHGLHDVAGIMMGASVLALLMTVIDRHLRTQTRSSLRGRDTA